MHALQQLCTNLTVAATTCKFKITNVSCKEKMALSKMAKHASLNKGMAWSLNEKVCAMLVDYMSEELQYAVVNSLTWAKFFRLQLDESKDS